MMYKVDSSSLVPKHRTRGNGSLESPIFQVFALGSLKKLCLAAACIQRLGKAPCLLIRGIPLRLLDPDLLFHLADEEQDVKFTPAGRNRGKLRHRDGPSGKLPDHVTGEER